MNKIGIVIIVLCCVSGTFFYAHADAVHKPCSFIIHGKGDFTPSIWSSIKQVTQECSRLSCKPSALTEIVQDAFPVISGVQIHRIKSGMAVVTLTAHTPLFKLNDEWVITDTFTVVKAHYYTPTVLTKIPSIKIAQSDVFPFVTPECKKFLTSLSPQFLDRYNVTWHDATTVSCTDKTDERISLIASSDTILTDALLERCQTVGTTLNESQKNKKLRWCFDLRFKDQIVLFAERGNGNEKSVHRQIAYGN